MAMFGSLSARPPIPLGQDVVDPQGMPGAGLGDIVRAALASRGASMPLSLGNLSQPVPPAMGNVPNSAWARPTSFGALPYGTPPIAPTSGEGKPPPGMDMSLVGATQPPPGTPNPPATPPALRPGGMFAGSATYLDDQAPPMTPTGLTSLMASPALSTDNAPLPHKPTFFQHHGLGEKLLKGFGEFALQYSASQGNPAAMATLQNRMLQQRQQQTWDHEDAAHRQDHQWDVDAATAKARLPEYFMSGKDRVAFDPTSGTSKVVYDGPSDAQDYADALGLEPGTPAYKTAVSDFVLRGNGSTALQNKTTLENVKVDGRTTVEGVRQRDRLQLRNTPTYANLHPQPRGGGGGNAGAVPRTMAAVIAPILAKVASGKTLSPAEQTAYTMYNSGRGHGGGRSAAGGGAGDNLPTISSPAQAAGLPRGTRFRTPDGRVKVVP